MNKRESGYNRKSIKKLTRFQELQLDPKLLLHPTTPAGNTVLVIPSQMADFENWIIELHNFDFGFDNCRPSVKYTREGVNTYNITVVPH